MSSAFIIKPKLKSICIQYNTEIVTSPLSANCLTLLLPFEGYAEMTIGAQSETLAKPTIAVIEPGTTYCVKTPSKQIFTLMEIYVEEIHVVGLEKNRLLGAGSTPFISIHKNADCLYKLADCLLAESGGETAFGSLEYCTSLLVSMILLVTRCLHVEKNQTLSSSVLQAKSYIEEHFQEDISLSVLADEIYVSLYYIAHTFKKEMGISPIQYLILVRMEKAKNMLTSTNKPIYEIAQEVGYENANYFNLMFSKMMGTSPGSYRKTYNKQKKSGRE